MIKMSVLQHQLACLQLGTLVAEVLVGRWTLIYSYLNFCLSSFNILLAFSYLSFVFECVP